MARPGGAIEVTAEPETRCSSTAGSGIPGHTTTRRTRKAVFFGYTYLWAAIRDDISPIRAGDRLDRPTPGQRQLLGGAEEPGSAHAWGLDPATTTLDVWLKEWGTLDPANPPLRA